MAAAPMRKANASCAACGDQAAEALEAALAGGAEHRARAKEQAFE